MASTHPWHEGRTGCQSRQESFIAAPTGIDGFSRTKPLPGAYLSNTRRMLFRANVPALQSVVIDPAMRRRELIRRIGTSSLAGAL